MTLDLDVFTGLVHFSEDLDTLSLNLSERALFDLSLLQSDLFGAVSMLLFDFFFSFNKSAL